MTELRKQINNIVEDYNACKVLAQSIENPSVYEGTTATAEDIREGKTAYSNGELITGELEISENNNNARLYTPPEKPVSGNPAAYYIEMMDFTGVTLQTVDCTSMFNGFHMLKTVKGLDTSNVTKMQSMFSGCRYLEYVDVMDCRNVTTLGGMFDYCTKLTDESLINIMQMIINGTNSKQTKSLQFLGIDINLRNRCPSLPNYQAFLDAGWRINT